MKWLTLHGKPADSVVLYTTESTAKEVPVLAAKQTVPYQGRQVSAQMVEFEAKTPEQFSQYKLEDGTEVKVKTVLLSVLRLDNEYNENGDPVYQFQIQQIIGAVVPDNLKRKPQ